MYRKIKIAGHLVHPMLIAFPVTCYTGTGAGFAVYAAIGHLFWLNLAIALSVGGVGSAVLAAIPGSPTGPSASPPGLGRQDDRPGPRRAERDGPWTVRRGHRRLYDQLAAQDDLTRIAPSDQRAEVSAAFYVCIYLGISLPVIGIGILADLTSLFTGVTTFAVVTGACALTVAAWHLRRRDGDTPPAPDHRARGQRAGSPPPDTRSATISTTEL